MEYNSFQCRHTVYFGNYSIGLPDNMVTVELTCQLWSATLSKKSDDLFNDIKELLRDIESFYQDYSPIDLKRRIKPASEAEITDFETEFGERLPDDYRSFLLLNKIKYQFVFNYECLNLKSVIKNWRIMNRLLDKGTFNDGRIERHIAEGFGNWAGNYLKVCWWNKKWLPFAQDSCGNSYCIDFDPGKKGKKYQIINMEIQGGGGPALNNRKPFYDFLKAHLNYLRNGQYRINEHGIEVDSYISPKKRN